MTMLEATLKTQLLTVASVIGEAAAIENFAEAFTTYFEDAETSTAIKVEVTPLRDTSGPKDSMKTALVGLNAAGASKLADGIAGFWAPILSTPGTYFLGTSTPSALPAGLAGLAATLQTTGDNNRDTPNDRDTAVGKIANDIHTANAGGTVTIPGPTVVTIV